jgi:hypothetical protein
MTGNAKPKCPQKSLAQSATSRRKISLMLTTLAGYLQNKIGKDSNFCGTQNVLCYLAYLTATEVHFFLIQVGLYELLG